MSFKSGFKSGKKVGVWIAMNIIKPKQKKESYPKDLNKMNMPELTVLAEQNNVAITYKGKRKLKKVLIADILNNIYGRSSLS